MLQFCISRCKVLDLPFKSRILLNWVHVDLHTYTNYWPVLLLHVRQQLPPALKAGQTRRGQRWADEGLETPERSGRRSDAMNYTRLSAAPPRWAAAPGENLIRTVTEQGNGKWQRQMPRCIITLYLQMYTGRLPDLDSLNTDITCLRKFVSCPVLFEIWFFGEMSSWHHSGPYGL